MSDGFVVFSPEFAFENSGFKASYFENLSLIEERSFWFRSRNRLIIWALRNYFPQARSFFEIGCGTGYVMTGVHKAFPELQVTGSEIHLTGLPYARQRLPSASLHQMDARAIPFYEEFDVIGAFDVLEHIEEDSAVLKEMYAAVRPGGGILLTVPQHAWLWSEVDDYSFHKRRYAKDDFLEKIVSAGFRIRRVTSFVSFLLPLMMLARLRYSLPFGKVDHNLEFKMGDGLNRFLESIMNLEMFMIFKNVNFGMGGSLFVVATKE
ncbi:MAG: class I SAM-dependent methyltransferase [Chloroflexi bacterium]|nr:class I SAM-dependent methyltransferase [Chloroflexota bacterium]